MPVDLAVTPTPGGGMADSGSMAKPGYKGKQKLDPYVRQIARALVRKKGFSESHAIAVAKNSTRKWAAGGKKVRPQVRAGAAASVANQARIDASSTGLALDLTAVRCRGGWVKIGSGVLDTALAERDRRQRGRSYSSDQDAQNLVDLAWTESLHPRQWDGKFGKKLGKAPKIEPGTPAHDEYLTHVAKLDTMLDHKSSLQERATDRLYGARDEHGELVKDAAGSIAFDDQRRALHRKIVKSVLDKQVRQGAKADRKALFLGGLPGAGKTRSLDKIPGVDERNYVTINPDIFKAELAARGHVPKVEGMSPMEASSLVHEESATMAMLLAQEARNRNLNIIWDITMNSPGSVAKRKAPLDELGYSTQAVFVDIPHELSVKRVQRRHMGGYAQERHENVQGGNHLGERFVPSGHVAGGKSKRGSSSANRDAFDEVKSSFDAYKLYNNFNGNENEFPLEEVESKGQFKA